MKNNIPPSALPPPAVSAHGSQVYLPCVINRASGYHIHVFPHQNLLQPGCAKHFVPALPALGIYLVAGLILDFIWKFKKVRVFSSEINDIGPHGCLYHLAEAAIRQAIPGSIRHTEILAIGFEPGMQHVIRGTAQDDGQQEAGKNTLFHIYTS
ncbi:hypothetical protein [Janthinobacterium lividum]|uniref:hypothetical protein n=1 Tax=Janthinobacterium lividum TaxID=29581 RepID=UPI001B8C969D|nr:hypothetical protein [Janthinobacterium lividum]